MTEGIIYMEEPSVFGQRLRTWRTRRKLTQEQLAEASGVKREIITMVENGRQRSTSLDNVVKLADALRVTLDNLVRGDPLAEEDAERKSELMAAAV